MALVAHVLARLRREPLADCPLAGHVEQLCRACGHGWRDRLLTPAVTLRLFLLQVLHGNAAIAHLRQLSGLAFAPASYCEARGRLPLGVILGLLGVVLGGVGVARSRTTRSSRWLSVAGVVLGVLALVVAILFWRAYANRLGNG